MSTIFANDQLIFVHFTMFNITSAETLYENQPIAVGWSIFEPPSLKGYANQPCLGKERNF
jgi:hypothetical protein